MGTHSNSKDGETLPTFITDKNERQFFLDNDQFAIQETIAAAAAQLPAEQQAENNINYLGSSYSGADIKVLVNLYSHAGSIDNVVAGLEKEKQIATRTKEAADALISGGLASITASIENATTFELRKNQILASSGLIRPELNQDESTQIAINVILSLFSGVNPLNFIEVAKLHRALQSLKTAQESQEKELEEQITELKKHTKNNKGAFLELGTLQTISVQSHREKFGVRALGHSYVKAYTRGPRTIAGSMIFTIFHEHAFAKLMRAMVAAEKNRELSSLIPDQLPPLDLTILFANEYGQTSEFRIYGLEILNDGVTYSIEDLLSENVIQFVARDVDPLVSKGNILADRKTRNIADTYNNGGARDLPGSQLVNMESDYIEYLNRLKVRRRLTNR